MVDLFDRFESEDLSAAGGAAREPGAGREGRQPHKSASNPCDEIEIGSLQQVSI